MKVTIQKACKLRRNNWKRGDRPTVTAEFAQELKDKGYLDAPKPKEQHEQNEE